MHDRSRWRCALLKHSAVADYPGNPRESGTSAPRRTSIVTLRRPRRASLSRRVPALLSKVLQLISTPFRRPFNVSLMPSGRNCCHVSLIIDRNCALESLIEWCSHGSSLGGTSRPWAGSGDFILHTGGPEGSLRALVSFQSRGGPIQPNIKFSPTSSEAFSRKIEKAIPHICQFAADMRYGQK